MRYLDEDIAVTIATSASAYGNATYTVTFNNEIVFAGNIYVPQSEAGSVTVHINEICESVRWNNTTLLMEDTTGYVDVNNWVGTFYVNVTFDDATYTGNAPVFLFYRNPRTLESQTMSGNTNLLQSGLQPHAPLKRTANNLLTMFYVSTIPMCEYRVYNGTSIPTDAKDGDEFQSYYILDECYSRFYLRWNDRFGGVQEQPFSGKLVYTENMTTTSIKNAIGHERKVEWNVTPKWQINTGFLDETVMHNYESIFVSPYLVLYDTAFDINYRVVLTDTTFTEKTYKNDKLFNLTLNVSLDKTQVIRN